MSGQGATVVGTASHLTGDGPQEAGQFAGHGGDHLAVRLAGMGEPPVAAAQAFLGGPGEGLGGAEAALRLRWAVLRAAKR